MSIKHLNARGAKDTTTLKETVLINFHGTVKSFSRKSLRYLDAENKFRYQIMKIADSR